MAVIFSPMAYSYENRFEIGCKKSSSKIVTCTNFDVDNESIDFNLNSDNSISAMFVPWPGGMHFKMKLTTNDDLHLQAADGKYYMFKYGEPVYIPRKDKKGVADLTREINIARSKFLAARKKF